jgi:hypothetical protein
VVTGVLRWLLGIFEGPRRPLPLKPSAKTPRLYEPRWGAYRRRYVANEKSQWQEEFDRALRAVE